MATDLFADLGDDIFDDPSLAAYTSPNPVRNRRIVPASAPTHLHQNHQGISSEPFDFDDHPPGFDPVTNRRKRKRRATDNVISLVDDDCPPGFDPVTNRRKRKRTHNNPISNAVNQYSSNHNAVEYGRNQQQTAHIESNTIFPISPTTPTSTNPVPQTPRPFHSHSRTISRTNNFNGNSNGINSPHSVHRNYTNSVHRNSNTNSNGLNTTSQVAPFRTPQPIHRRNNAVNGLNRNQNGALSANRVVGGRSHHNTNTNRAMRPSRNIQSLQNAQNRQSTAFTPLQPIQNGNQSNYRNTVQSVQMNRQHNRPNGYSHGHSNGYINPSLSSDVNINSSHSNHIPVNQQPLNHIPRNQSPPHSAPPASNRTTSTTNSNASNASNFEAPVEDIPEAPECSHKQAMVQRVTRKMGPNQGRKFWCCGMAQQDKCKSFQWDGMMSTFW